MAEMKGIKLCGECINYNWKTHKCKIGCNDDSNAQAPFYGDCPLPDVVPKSEFEKQKLEIWRLQGEVERLKAENETLDLGLKDLRFRNKELQNANEGWAKSFEDFEIQLEEAIEFRKNQVKRIFDDIEHLCIDTFGNFNHRVFAKLKDKYI